MTIPRTAPTGCSHFRPALAFFAWKLSGHLYTMPKRHAPCWRTPGSSSIGRSPGILPEGIDIIGEALGAKDCGDGSAATGRSLWLGIGSVPAGTRILPRHPNELSHWILDLARLQRLQELAESAERRLDVAGLSGRGSHVLGVTRMPSAVTTHP